MLFVCICYVCLTGVVSESARCTRASASRTAKSSVVFVVRYCQMFDCLRNELTFDRVSYVYIGNVCVLCVLLHVLVSIFVEPGMLFHLIVVVNVVVVAFYLSICVLSVMCYLLCEQWLLLLGHRVFWLIGIV